MPSVPLLPLLEKRLAKFSRDEDALDALADRILQKNPSALARMRDLRPSHLSLAERKKAFLSQQICLAVDASRGGGVKGMPAKMENYLAFVDLFSLVMDAARADGGGKRTWDTFVLQDYDVRSLSKTLHKCSQVKI